MNYIDTVLEEYAEKIDEYVNTEIEIKGLSRIWVASHMKILFPKLLRHALEEQKKGWLEEIEGMLQNEKWEPGRKERTQKYLVDSHNQSLNRLRSDLADKLKEVV